MAQGRMSGRRCEEREAPGQFHPQERRLEARTLMATLFDVKVWSGSERVWAMWKWGYL